MTKQINLTYLYPDICNLHGDRGNVWAFERVAKQLGLNLKINRVDQFNSPIDFEKSDILLISPGEITHLIAVLKELNLQKGELTNYIENNRYFITIGTTGAIFTKEIVRTDGNVLKGLGIINGTCTELAQPLGDDIIFSCNINEKNHKACGSQIQMVDIELNDNNFFANVIYGYGNNKRKVDGYKKNNFIFTNCLGPIFTKNPWLVETILRDIAKKKNIPISQNITCDFSSERISYIEIEKYNLNKELPVK